jgi:hypothetical protein
MEAEETFVGCCPEGFKCDNLQGQTCLMRAKSTQFPTISCEGGSSNNFGFTTLPNRAVTAMNLYAPMIQIAWKASDRPETSTLSSATTGVTTSAPTTTVPNSTSTPDSPAPVTSEPSISTGVIVGIAIGAAALFLLTLAAAIFIWRRRRHNNHLGGGGIGGDKPSDSGSNSLPYAALRADSPGIIDTKHYYTGGVMEMGQGHERVEAPSEGCTPVEAPVQGHERAEMCASKGPFAPQSSLVEAPAQGNDRAEMYAANSHPVPIRGEGMSPPPGYFQGQMPVEMPTRRYD